MKTERFEGNELGAGDAFEKMAGGDFTGKLHQAKNPEQFVPPKLRQFPEQQLTEQDAVSSKKLAYPVLLNFRLRKRIFPIGLLFQEIPVAHKGP